MTRDFGRLASDSFDLLIIGGGIYGLAAAHDAARRGHRVALVERHDFGSGTSFNHHKTLHGGLRYLQSLDLPRMRESIRERRAFARIAAPLVRPQQFVMPTTSSVTRGRVAMQIAFSLDRIIAADRNSGVPGTHVLPAGRVIPRDELLRLAPDLTDEGVTGGAAWYDYLTTESERLTLSFAIAAGRHGATVVNYADAIAPLREGQRVVGMQVRDGVTGDAVDVRAAVTLNAAGAGAGRVMAMFGTRRPFPLLKAMNLVTSRPAGEVALACPTREGRMLVALPWRGHLMVGTSHGADVCGPDQTVVNESEVESFLGEVNSAFPWLALRRDEITLVHRGIVPARVSARRPPELLDHPEVRDHAAEGIDGAVSIVGVKYTTARGVAARAVDVVCRKLGRVAARRPREEPLIVTDGTVLGNLYGDAAPRVQALSAADPALREPITPGSDVIGAQVVHAVREEMALTLEDVVIRRTSLGAAGHPDRRAVAACAALMQRELGWSPEQVAEECAAVRRFYEIGAASPGHGDDE